MRAPAPPAERLILSRLSAHGTGPEPEGEPAPPPWVPVGFGNDWRLLCEPAEHECIGEELSTGLGTEEADGLREEPPLGPVPPRSSVATEGGLIGESPAILFSLALADAYAKETSEAILIEGETGTGKELVARGLHLCSGLKGGFVRINCAGLNSGLLESELFGHEQGSFTGATASREGVFEQAERGTLFLDEVGDMPSDLQAKLLRVLDGAEFTRVGGNEPIRPNVRVIAATHHHLPDLVEEGKFRADLRYRLSVLKIHLPPLLAREGDVRLLAKHFLKVRGCDATLREETTQILDACPWDGNVRELEHVMVSAAIHAGDFGEILPGHLRPDWLKENEVSLDSLYGQAGEGARLVHNLRPHRSGVASADPEGLGDAVRELVRLVGDNLADALRILESLRPPGTRRITRQRLSDWRNF